MERVSELEVPSEFDEIELQEESNCIIRTLVSFWIEDGDGKLAYVEDLGSGKSQSFILRGTVVEPLASSVREATVGMLCTSAPEASATSSDMENNAFEEPIVEPLNRSQLVVGSTVDGYCNKTFKWYEAKIIDAANDDKGDRLKIHFKGWSSKHDEWIHRSSERIATIGSSQLLMEAALRRATRMVPWFDTEGVDKLIRANSAKSSSGHPPKPRKTIDIEVCGLDDFCVDYSYANPTLWLISSNNVWYRVAGAVCPGGASGSPNPNYSKIFASIVSKFNCAAHVAMALIDFLPSVPKMGLDIVTSEVLARSKGEFDETVILSNWRFLYDQLQDIAPPAEWDCKISIPKTTFMSQLKKQGDAFIRSGGKPGITSASEAGLLKKKKVLDSSTATINPAPEKKSKGSESKPVDELEQFKQATNKMKFPIEDKEYWQLYENHVGKSGPIFPAPLFSNQLNSVHRITCPSVCIGSLLQVWTTLVNFRPLLGLPSISLACLDAFLLPGHGVHGSYGQSVLEGGSTTANSNIYSSLSSFTIHPMLREINIALLSIILQDKYERGVLKELEMHLSSVRQSSKHNSLGVDDEEESSRTTASCFLGWFPDDLGRSKDAVGTTSSSNSSSSSNHSTNSISASLKSSFESSFLSYLHSGDGWVELFRVLVACSHKIDMPEYFDPISECRKIIKFLLKDPDCDPFSSAVDPDEDGAPDYYMVIKEPMDLNKILHRIDSGWYDPTFVEAEGYSTHRTSISCDNCVSESRSSSPCVQDGLVRFSVGNVVDYYSTKCSRWYEAEVISIDELENSMKVSIKGLSVTETVSMTSAGVAPAGSVSHNLNLRSVAPDLIENPASWEPASNSARESQSKLHSASQFGGHEAIARDVRLVWSNCVAYMSRQSAEHPLIESSSNLSAVFESLYESRIIAPLKYMSALSKLHDKSNSSIVNKEPIGATEAKLSAEAETEDWGHLVEFLSSYEYSNAAVELKLLLLTWACNEILQTNKCRVYFDTVVDNYLQRTALARANSAAAASATKPNEDEVDEPPKKKKATTSVNGKAKPFVDDEAPTGTILKISKSTAIEAAGATNATATTTAPADDQEIFEETMRLLPLGRDRDCRTYWVFNNAVPQLLQKGSETNRVASNNNNAIPSRIFCEDPMTSEWYIFTDERDIFQLWSWLNEKGVRESALKKAISEWADGFGLNLARKAEEAAAKLAIKNAVQVVNSRSSSSRRKSGVETVAAVAETAAVLATDDAVDTTSPTKPASGMATVDDQSSPQHQQKHQQDQQQYAQQQQQVQQRAYAHIKDFTDYWAPRESDPLSFVVHVYLSRTNNLQLGIGLKPIGNAVVVSSIKFDANQHSAGYASGLRVGDIIVFAEDRYVADIDALKAVIKDIDAKSAPVSAATATTSEDTSTTPANEQRKSLRAATAAAVDSSKENNNSESNSRTCLRLLVLRYSDLRACPVLFEGIESDANLKVSFQKQESTYTSMIESKAFRYQSVIDTNCNSSSNSKAEAPTSVATTCSSTSTNSNSNSNSNRVLSTEVRYDAQLHPLREVHYYPSRVVGAFVALVLRSLHPFCVSDEWVYQSIPTLFRELFIHMKEIDEQVYQRIVLLQTASQIPINRRQTKTFQKLESQIIDIESSILQLTSKLLARIVSDLLALENVLTVSGNMFRKDWIDNRMRFKWQMNCTNIKTFAKLSNCLNQLVYYIDWSQLATASSCLTVSNWHARAPKYFKTVIPAENSLVVYFGDGQLQQDRLDHLVSNKPKMWGSTADWKPAVEGCVCACIVSEVRVLLSGPTERFFPFAQIDLMVVNSKLTQTAPQFVPDNRPNGANTISSRNSISQVGHVYRIVNRVVNYIRTLPEAKAFLEPVSAAEFPDYYDVIVDPVDLTLIRLRAREAHYSRIDAFLDDMNKLRANCEKYCEVLYPNLVTVSRQLVEEATTLVDLLNREYLQVFEDTRDREEMSMQVSDKDSSSAVAAVAAQSANAIAATAQVIKKGTSLRGIPLPQGQSKLSIGTAFTICVRLNNFDQCPYLISAKKYTESHVSFQEGSIVRVNTTKFEYLSEDSATAGYRYGTVIGCKSDMVDGFIPWGWIQVEWADGAAENVWMNPWDVELVSNRSSGSKRDTKKTKLV